MVARRWWFGGRQQAASSAPNPKGGAEDTDTAGKWESQRFPPLPTARSGCAVVALPQERLLMVLGGVDREGHDLLTADCLSLPKKSWITDTTECDSGANEFPSALPTLHTARHGCAAVVVRPSLTATRNRNDHQATDNFMVVVTGGIPSKSLEEKEEVEDQNVESNGDRRNADPATNLINASDISPPQQGELEQSEQNRNVEIWTKTRDKFMKLPATLQHPHRDGCALVVSPSKRSMVHVVGGHDGRGRYHKSVESYDFSLELRPGAQRIAPASLAWRKWFPLPDMRVGRAYCGAVCLFRQETTRTATVPPDSTTTTTSAWSMVDHGATTPPLLVVLGGMIEDGIVTKSVECFDFESQLWFDSLLPPMQDARAAFATVVVDHVIYVMGGVGSHGGILDSCEALHLGDCEWKVLPQRLSSKRAGCAAVVVDSDERNNEKKVILLLGGHDGEQLLTSVECLDLVSEGKKATNTATDEDASCSWHEQVPLPEISPLLEAHSRDSSARQAWFDETTQAMSHVQDKVAAAQTAWQDQRAQHLAAMRRCQSIQLQLLQKQHELQLQHLDFRMHRQWQGFLQRHVDPWMTQVQSLLRQAQDEQEGSTNTTESQQAPWTSASIPSQLRCPLSKQLMVDPVIATDGYAYERRFIDEYLKQFSESATVISPISNVVLTSRNLIPAVSIQSMCDDYRRHDGEGGGGNGHGNPS